MQISKFWKTLDDLVDAATDRHEWKALLGGEWDQLSSLLTPTGSLAMSISCPSPGGGDCPRRIVRHADGSIRAVCGDSPKACRDLDLSKNDIAVLRLDLSKLAAATSRALGLSNIPKRFEQDAVVQIGTHDVFAGLGFPVFLCVPGPQPSDNTNQYQRVMTIHGPKLLLVPTARSIPDTIMASLNRSNITTMSLQGCLTISDNEFAPAHPVETLFADLREQLNAQDDALPSNLAWQLPPDARWEELSIRFVAAEVLNVGFRSETRRFEPDHLGMKSAKNGRPLAVWTFLKAFGLQGGRLHVHRSDPKETSKHQKQKQALSKSLRDAFGIAEEPIPSEGGQYVTRFVVSANDLRQGQQDQR